MRSVQFAYCVAEYFLDKPINMYRHTHRVCVCVCVCVGLTEGNKNKNTRQNTFSVKKVPLTCSPKITYLRIDEWGLWIEGGL